MEVSWVTKKSRCLFTAIYGSPQKQFRRYLWDDLSQLASSIHSPWLLVGDFNAILSANERRGRSSRRAQGCASFNKFIHYNGFLDMGSTSPSFTWKRGTLLMRLDRAICNSDWVQSFPHYGVDHLPKVFSDHRPILINLNLDSQRHISPFNKPFRFMAPWLTHPDFSPLVQRIWRGNGDILNCITSFTEEVQRWNLETFGAIGKRKRKLLNRIRGIQTRLEGHPNNYDFLTDLDLSLRDEFENVFAFKKSSYGFKNPLRRGFVWVTEIPTTTT
ncbi:hypothetical protein K1719_040734 [Acacia pycnantha]|nr:hypothetical protein K1719_040734 [Acacia pycnantha]